MTGSPENIPLGECPLSQSRDQLTPPSRTESTVFSLSRSESLWTTEASGPGIYQVYWFAIHLMMTPQARKLPPVVIRWMANQ